MGVVNRTTRGLLSLLDSQTQGVVPSSLGEVIAPTMDVTRFIEAGKGFEYLQSTAFAAAAGPVFTQTVPAGEMWMVYDVALEAFAREAVGAGVAVQVNLNTATVQFPVCRMEGAAIVLPAIGHAVSTRVHFDNPPCLNQGQGMQATIATFSGVPVLGWNLVQTLRIIRVQV